MKLGVTLDILNQKATPAFYADTLANRPAAGFTGRVFISTDTLDLYRDTGTTWVLLSPSSTGTITGSGAAGQVTYFSGTSSITGSNNLFYDTGNSRLGINTNAPTAPLDVHSSLSGALLQLNQTSGTFDSQLAFQSANVGKWRIGSYYNAGQYSFGIYDVFNSRERFSVLNTGQTFVGDQVSSSGQLVINSGSLGDNGLVVISQSSPSIRINNGGSGANFRCGLGIATAANNFIQGSVDGDFCIFNANTGTYPILFGINDTGAGNVQEAARISPARNLLVGTSVDAGQRLQVSGAGTFTSSLTTTQLITRSASGSAALFLKDSSANNKWEIGHITNSLYFYNYTNSSNAFIINGSTNAATFTNSLSASTTINIDTSANPTLNFITNSGATTTMFNIVGAAYVGSAPFNSNILRANNSSNISFELGGSEAARFVGTTRNLLIGTTTDSGPKLQVEGTALMKNFIRIQANTTTSVSTSPTIISPGSNTYGGLAIVWGSDAGGNIWTNLIFYSLGTVLVLASQDVSGGPDGRTYSVDGLGNLRLAMAANTYTVRFQALLTS